jgi:hypothetical protein
MKEKKRRDLSKILRWVAIVLLLVVILRGFLLLVVLIGLSIAISFLVNNFPIRQLGIELVTFIAVLSGLKYGPWVALLVTFILITYHMVAGGFIGNYVLWVIPAYCVAAVISGFLPYAEVTELGIYATFAINLNNIFFTAITGPTFLPRYIPYAITNVIFNVFLFTVFGQPMLLLIR